MVTLDLTVVDCFQRGVLVSNYSICAEGDIRTNVKGVCKGDSGGGLITRDSTLIGVLNAGFFCGEYNEPAVYCNVFLHKQWIESTLSELDTHSSAGRCPMIRCEINFVSVVFVFVVLVL